MEKIKKLNFKGTFIDSDFLFDSNRLWSRILDCYRDGVRWDKSRNTGTR